MIVESIVLKISLFEIFIGEIEYVEYGKHTHHSR